MGLLAFLNYPNVVAAWQCSLVSRKQARRAHTVRIRCARSTEGGNRRSLDTWIGRAAMLGFVAAIGVEVSTGKGVLEVNSFSPPQRTSQISCRLSSD